MTATAPTTTRRITEDDADYLRLHRRTLRGLKASVARLVRELRAARHDPNGAANESAITSRFLASHTQLLRDAYLAAWREGTRDYYQTVSNRPQTMAPTRGANEDRMRRALRFYAPSVAKLAMEARNAAYRVQLDELSDWQGGLEQRLTLQAEIVWVGLQEGYVEGGSGDVVVPWRYLYWDLGIVKTFHCVDCPAISAASPYDAPGYGPHVIWQSPGDGRTQCGAGCKCSLRYGAGSAATRGQYAWDGTKLPTPAKPAEPQQPQTYTWQEVQLLDANASALSAAQRGALDRFRASWSSWEDMRGAGGAEVLPSLPEMFAWGSDLAPEDAALAGVDWSLYWARLSEEQRALLLEIGAAIEEWNRATAETTTTQQPSD